MEHIFNCHGEWFFMVQAVATIPLVGAWIKMIVSRHNPPVDGKGA